MDDELKRGTVKIPVTYELWKEMDAEGNHAGILSARAIDALRLQGYNDVELEIVQADPTFNESIRETCQNLRVRIGNGKAAWGKKVKIHFGQPASRSGSGKDIAEDN